MAYPVGTILISVALSYVIATIIACLVAQAKFPLPTGERRIGCIDGLRGYLALSVLAHHFIIWIQVVQLGGSWDPPGVNFFNQLGEAGVALFFMITGLVFYPRVLIGFRDSSWIAIYLIRSFRILPLVIVSVFVITAIIVARTGRGFDSNFPIAAATWIATLGEPPLLGYPDSRRLNADVLWSLRYEWLFYLLVLPACALAMDLIKGKFPSWIVPLFLLIFSLLARLTELPSLMLSYLPLFAIGMIAYECQRREWISRYLRAPMVGIAAVVSLGIGMFANPTPYNSSAPLIGFFFLCVACGNSIGGLLKTNGSLVLGECSYSIYLLHGTILSLFFEDAGTLISPLTLDQLTLTMPMIVFATTIMTSATYIFIERPAIRAGSCLAKRWTGRRARPVASDLDRTS